MSIKFSYQKETAKGVVTVRLAEGEETYRSKEKEGEALVVGVGKRDEMTRRRFIALMRRVVRTAKAHKLEKIALDGKDLWFPKLDSIPLGEYASLVAENMEMANFEFTRFKSDVSKYPLVKEVIITGEMQKASLDGVKRGQIVAGEANGSRALANTPGGEMTPEILAKEAEKAARGTKIKVTILDEKKIAALKMGALLGVAKGSAAKPRFIIMEYMGGKKGEAPIVFVGKGVTFDTGGINLKPDQASLGMHMDMSGGAAVIHAIVAAAKLGVKKNIVTLVPSVENMVSGEAYRPGDVLRSMSGTTIDVLHTDAEGRLILADALTYAERYKPSLVVDVATLTGGAIAALGMRATAIMTRDEALEKRFRELGEETGDYVWPLPLWDEYEADVKGVFGDIANIPQKPKTGASAINGGMFLYQFAKKFPWVHMDIAPRMEATSEDNLAQGSAGEPVRLLVKLAETY